MMKEVLNYNDNCTKSLRGQGSMYTPVIIAATPLALLSTTSAKKAEHILAKC